MPQPIEIIELSSDEEGPLPCAPTQEQPPVSATGQITTTTTFDPESGPDPDIIFLGMRKSVAPPVKVPTAQGLLTEILWGGRDFCRRYANRYHGSKYTFCTLELSALANAILKPVPKSLNVAWRQWL